MKTAKPAAPASPLRERCPVLTQVPVGFIALITALIMIAVMVLALGMAAHGFHPMHLAATGIAWANM